MPIFNVPGYGAVQLPEGLKPQDYQNIIRGMQMEYGEEPRYSTSQVAFRPIQRTFENIGTSIRKELPAMGLAAIGQDDTARALMEEAKQEYTEREQRLPRMYQSYEDVTGPLSALGFGYERAAEALPYGLAMLLPGGAAAAGARGIAARAGASATEAALARGLSSAAAESAGAARAAQVTQRAALGGAGAGGYTLNAPETFSKVLEETGELRPGVASVAAIGQTFLDLVAPASFLSKLGGFGRAKMVEEMTKRAGFKEAAKDIGLAAAKTAPKEGLTEAAQEFLSNVAVKYVDENYDLFSPERIKEYIEAGLSGAAGGAALGAAGRGIQRVGMPVEQPVQAEQTPLQPTVTTQPELSSERQRIPPRGGITGTASQQTVANQAVTPTISTEITAAPTGGGLQNLATMGGGLVDAMYDQLLKAHQQGTTTIAGNTEYILEVAKERGRTFNTPEDIKKFVQEPGVGERVQEMAQIDRVKRLAKAGKTPDEIRKIVPSNIDVEGILGIKKGPEPTGELTVPVPPSETLQLAAPEEGPPEFVEPPPSEESVPLSDDLQAAIDEETALIKRRDETKRSSLWSALKGRISYEDIKDASPDRHMRTLAGTPGKKIDPKTGQDFFRGLDLLIEEGELDPWLPTGLKSTDIANNPTLEKDASDAIKSRLLSGDYLTEGAKIELKRIGKRLDELVPYIQEYESELEALRKQNLEAAEAAAEQRPVYEQVETVITGDTERAAGPREEPAEAAAPSEVRYTPQSYAEQMMSGTLPDTDEANAYFEANRDAIEVALNDLEERRAEPMMRGTAEQKKTAKSHASDLGGIVVYLDGDLALIRGHSRLTGQPVYLVSNGGFRSRVDVDAYTGSLINAKQKAKLVAARNAIELKEEEKHAKSPFIKFDSQGVAVSQSVSPQLAGVIAGWKKLLKVTPKIYVTTISDIEANLDKFTGPHRAVGSAALGNEYGSVRKMADGEYYIAFTDGMSMSRMLETLAHELGHMHMRETFDNADVATQKAICDEYDKWLKSIKGKSAREHIQSMRARGLSKLEKIGEKRKSEDLDPYWSSFKEWYADQVSRWATTSEKPLNVVERFFKRLADAMRSFYAKLRNQKYLPNETFKQYMDKVTANIDYVGPVRMATKPLGKIDQMALFMRAAINQFDTPEFKRWFGNSKVVGPDGKPLVVYHGSIQPGLRRFDLRKAVEVEGGLFFTDNMDVADQYTYERAYGDIIGEEPLGEVLSVYLSIQNPLEYRTKPGQRIVDAIEMSRAIKQAKAAGHDGLIIRNIDDSIGQTGDMSDIYVAFDPRQIKSIENVGSFDPSSTEIYYMRRAADEFTDAGKDMSPEDQEKLLQDVDQLDTTPQKGMNAVDSMIKETPSFQSVKEKLHTYVNDATTNNADSLLAFLNMRQISEMAKKVLPQFAQYYRVITTMIDSREKQQTDAAKIYQRWEDWATKNPELGKALDQVMMDARMSGIDPTDPKKEAKIKKESFLANWNKIKGGEGEKIFVEVRDFWKKQLDRKREILEKKIMIMQTDETERQKTIAELRQEFEKFVQDGPYFPLTRFGDYYVAYNIKLADGSTKPYHEMFESQADQRRHLESIEKDIESGKIIDVKSGVDTKEMMSQGVIKSQFLNKVFKAVDGMDQGDLYKDSKQRVKDDIYQAYLSMMPDLSVHKHFIHAKKVAGASLDFRRGFAETAFHNINHLSRLDYGYVLDQIVAEASRVARDSKSNAAGRYLKELDKMHAEFSNPQKQNPIWSKISNFSFLFYLTAPASAIVNMTQTPIIGMPTMAGQFNTSFTRVGVEIAKASKEFFASRQGMEFKLSDYLRKQGKKSEADALDELESTLNRTQTLSLAGIAERPSFMYAKGIRGAMRSKSLSKIEKINYALGYAFNQAEIYNRYVTALVAIRLANEANAKSKAAGGFSKYDPAAIAREMVNQIHFEYSAETKPRFMRGPFGQVALQFKNYSQQITYLLVDSLKRAMFSNAEIKALRLRSLDKGLSESDRLDAKREYEEAMELRRAARKRLTGILGMTALFSGYEGLPLYWVIEGTMNMLLGDEDEPYDFSLEMKVAMAEAFGDNVSRIFSRGAMSELLQIDLASRTSLNGIWFRDDASAKDEEEWTKNMLIDLMGPAAGIVVNTGDAIKKINEGHYWRGTEAMLPPVIKDFFKAARFATEGATTLRGDPIDPDISAYNVFMQALGFTPTDVARGYEAMGEIKGIEKKIEQRRSRLLGKLWLAHQNGDYEAYAEIGEDIVNFNAANPNEPIDDKTIKNSFAQRMRTASRAERGIIVSPKRQYLLEKTSYLDEE